MEHISKIVKRTVSGKKHLAWIRTLPCVICGKWGPNHPHHLMRGVSRGMGMRAEDRFVIPLCHIDHDKLHANGDEISFLSILPMDAIELADELYSRSGSDSIDWMESLLTEAWENQHYSHIKDKLK